MTQIEGAVIREQGVTFAVVIVRPSVIQNSFEAGRAIQSFQPIFPGIPVVLMARDRAGLVDGRRLGVVNRGGALGAGAADGPPSLMRHNMLISLGHLGFSLTQQRRDIPA